MSMKKKFLALALAGAVALPMTVNATSHIVTGVDTQAQEGQITINGVVQTKTGQAPDGQISVELPTSVGFTVDQNGTVIPAGSGSYSVQNKGKNPVDLSVVEFSETQLTTGITVRPETELSSTSRSTLNRSNVYLQLSGNAGTADLGKIKNNPSDTKILEDIPAGGSSNITLSGVAGNKTDATFDNVGTSENFVVKFKVTK